LGELLENGALLRVPVAKILTSARMAEIEHALAEHARDRRLRLVVLQGEGGNFSYGASVEEHRRETAPAMLHSLSRLVRAIARYPAPVAAFVEGRCLGGAFELLLACHLVFARPDAQMGCPEIKLGVFPPVLAALGPWRLGGGLSDRLLLTGETLDAARAMQAGLLSAVFESFDQLLEWFRKGPATLSAEALRTAALATRSHFDDARIEQMERLYLDRVLASHDGNEGIEAFVARRPPVWTDE
jgi:cyclohexa-1,5-dienecarbonyl-CoA hydratase